VSSPRDADVYGVHYLYRCFDADDQLLYIGCARDVEGRMYHHTQLCNIGKQPNGTLRRHMARWTSEAYPNKLAARAAERAAIRDEAPLLNKQHNPTRFRRLGVGGPTGGGDRSGYGLVEPVHPLTRAAFPDAPVVGDALASTA
jgi:predicted GIY-YIG superfamily endonuclease